MTRVRVSAIIVAASVGGAALLGSVSAQRASGLSGQWTINRELSEIPREIGFTADWMKSAAESDQSGGAGGRGGRRSGGGSSRGGANPFAVQRESADDAKRLQILTAEVRNPPKQLTIVEAPDAVTITSERGQSRTFHPNGRDDVLSIDDVPVGTNAKWEAGHLVVLYNVEEGHQLRYSYSTSSSPARLRVDVKFVERGGGDSAVMVYDPGIASEPRQTVNAPSSTASNPVSPAQPVNQKPGSELKGLTRVGVVVEDLGSQAAGCNLNQSSIETSVAKVISDAGLRVARNSDEDTYVYVAIMTTSLPTGLCVSRYDVSLFTHTTATLSYQASPSLLQVSLLHKGGLSGGGPSAHAAAVLQGVKQYVEGFTAQIRDANK
jgi:hypothetical protein